MKKLILVIAMVFLASNTLAFSAQMAADKAKNDPMSKEPVMMMDKSGKMANESGSMQESCMMMDKSGKMASESESMKSPAMMMEKTEPMAEKEMPNGKTSKAKEASSY